MSSIEIPLPEFGFDEIAKDKAQFIIRHIFHQNSLLQYFTGGNPGLKERLEQQIHDLYEDYERLICISELLNFLIKEENKLKENITFYTKDPILVSVGFNKIRYILYSLAKASCGFTFDKNTFSIDEAITIHSKIDDIVYSLKKLEAGQEVLYNEIIIRIEDEFNDLKSLPVFGKKKFYELMFGKIATFTGNKMAEEIFKKLEPHIIALILLHAPHLVEEAKKLLG